MKIAIITDRFPPQSATNGLLAYSSAIELSQLGHQVQILTSFTPDQAPPPLPDKVELLQSFKNWGFWETSRIVPLLVQYRPDSIHIFPSGKGPSKKTLGAFNLISSVKPLLGSTKFVTSISDIEKFPEGLLMNLARNSDFLTFNSRDIARGRSFSNRFNPNLKIEELDPSFSFISLIPTRKLEIELPHQYIWLPNQLEEIVSHPELLKKYDPILSERSELHLLITGAELQQKNSQLRTLQNFLNTWVFGGRVQIHQSWNPISAKSFASQVQFTSVTDLSNTSPLKKIIEQFCALSEIPELIADQNSWTSQSFEVEDLQLNAQENALSRLYSEF